MMGPSFEVGRYTCVVLDHGPGPPTDASVLCVNVGADEASSIVGAEVAPSGFNSLLVMSGDVVIVVDTGLGSLVPGGVNAFVAKLKAADVHPDDVTHVLTSHAHADHTGAHCVDGGPLFTRATYFVPRADWRWFVEEAEADDVGASVARTALAPLTGSVELFDGGELLPGVEAVPAPGHTPGHTVFRITADGGAGLYAADSILFPGVVARPDVWSSFDMDGPRSVSSRLKVLERAAEEGSTVVAYHCPGPGIGRVQRSGTTFRWEGLF